MPLLHLLPHLHDAQTMNVIAMCLLCDPSLEGKDGEAECGKFKEHVVSIPG